MHTANYKRKGHVIDIKLLPLLFKFYVEKIEATTATDVKLSTGQKYLIQNLIMFLAFKEQKSPNIISKRFQN